MFQFLEKDVGIDVVLHEDLERANLGANVRTDGRRERRLVYLGRESLGLKDASTMHVPTHALIDFTFSGDQMPLIARIVEGVGSQTHDTCLRYDIQAKFCIDDTSTSLGQVALVRNEATTSEAARAERFL